MERHGTYLEKEQRARRIRAEAGEKPAQEKGGAVGMAMAGGGGAAGRRGARVLEEKRREAGRRRPKGEGRWLSTLPASRGVTSTAQVTDRNGVAGVAGAKRRRGLRVPISVGGFSFFQLQRRQQQSVPRSFPVPSSGVLRRPVPACIKSQAGGVVSATPAGPHLNFFLSVVTVWSPKVHENIKFNIIIFQGFN